MIIDNENKKFGGLEMKCGTRLRQLYRSFYKRVICRSNPVRYAKKVGVNIAGNLKIYGEVVWGSEPWLISIGDNVHITNGVKFLTHEGGVLIYQKAIPDLEVSRPIKIGNDVFIGNDVLILSGATIGNNVIVGAGAIVTKDIPDNSLAVGIPAKVIKSADEYLEKLKSESSHLGNLPAEEKDIALRKYFGYTGNTKGIYF
jgi:acetyltransferase-like isoleucine patch superfamily enzyme